MKTFSRFVLAAALAALPLTPLAARAQGQPAPAAASQPMILVVDIPLVLRESKVGKSIGQQIEQQKSVYQKDIATQEKDLNNAGAELKRQEQILARDAYEARARELQQRANDLQKNFEGKRETLQRADGSATNQVLQTVFTIIRDIAAERHATHVLVRSPQIVAYVDPSFDVTDETLRRLDQRLPALAVSFNVPAGAPTAAAPGSTQSAAKGKAKADHKKN
jgi:Skp family chaperone for outer membrane proteins